MAEAVAQAAIAMSEHLSAAAIICLTESGRTARRISKYRPASSILAVAMDERVVRRLAMNWGVMPLLYQGEVLDAARVQFAIERAKKGGILRRGDVVVATGSSTREGASTDQIRVVTVA
jgi:pyruvate kinase